MAQYTIGLDYGTLSLRGVLVDVENGHTVSESTYEYSHGVMERSLPDGTPLDCDWALQHPQDYLDGLRYVVPDLIEKSKINKNDIIGFGIDFTSCTVIATLSDGTPLCFLPEYKNRPHAYVKLWKHHAAQNQADRINALAKVENPEWFRLRGGKISSECLFPKMLEVLEKDEEIYNKAECFMEAADWLTWLITGVQTRGACLAGYRAFWHNGYPPETFFEKLDKRFKTVVKDKLNAPVIPTASCAGYVSRSGAALSGLPVGIPVSSPTIDAHSSMAGAGIHSTGSMLLICGTSAVQLLLGDKNAEINGICGTMKDGYMPGFYCHEAGQCCFGDHYRWFMENILPESYSAEAREKNISVYRLLEEKISNLRPGQSGLIALDWWNGNRSVLNNGDLTGLIVGMTLNTRPEEIYKALIEATIYGTRVIIETFTRNNVKISDIYATGGIVHKDRATMQMYADILGKPIKIVKSQQGAALSSAIFAASVSRYKTESDPMALAMKNMVEPSEKTYYPISENSAVYDRLFQQYKKLHDLFGGECGIMKQLKEIKYDANRN